MGNVSIKLKRNAATDQYRGHKGDVITIPEKEAMGLVEKNYAEIYDSPREPEPAPEVKKEPEKKPAPKSRKKTAVAPQGDRVADAVE